MQHTANPRRWYSRHCSRPFDSRGTRWRNPQCHGIWPAADGGRRCGPCWGYEDQGIQRPSDSTLLVTWNPISMERSSANRHEGSMDLRNAAAPKNAPNWRRTDLDLMAHTYQPGMRDWTGRVGKEVQREDIEQRYQHSPSVSTPAASTGLLLSLLSKILKHGNQTTETGSTSQKMTCDRHRRRRGGCKRHELHRDSGKYNVF